MMQRILTGFSALPGADQAYIVSRREGLVAAVGKRGRAPDVEHATQLIQALINSSQPKVLAEAWNSGQGDGLYLLTRINEDASIVISGKKVAESQGGDTPSNVM